MEGFWSNRQRNWFLLHWKDVLVIVNWVESFWIFWFWRTFLLFLTFLRILTILCTSSHGERICVVDGRRSFWGDSGLALCWFELQVMAAGSAQPDHLCLGRHFWLQLYRLFLWDHARLVRLDALIIQDYFLALEAVKTVFDISEQLWLLHAAISRRLILWHLLVRWLLRVLSFLSIVDATLKIRQAWGRTPIHVLFFTISLGHGPHLLKF